MELKNVRQNVFRYLAQINISAKLDDCMALIIAEILGYINKKNADNYKPWADICFRIKNYNTLNKAGLLEKIKTEILQNFTLEKKRELLETKAIYALDMDEIIFTEKFIEDTKNQPYLLRTNYGGKDYSTATINTTLAPSKKNIDATKATTKIDYFICQEETELNNFWKTLVTEERKKLFPFWKWKISTTEFQSLEEKLIALLKSKNQNNVIENHAFKLALYYCEWYKRKYIGNDSIIDTYFEPISAQSIWNHLSEDIQNIYLITINKSKRWDDSLKLLGGLPLSYLTSGGNNPSRVFTKVFNDIRSEKAPDLNELDVNNQAMRQSAQPGGSIYEYINELINENFPFYETDKAEPPFKEFIAFVEIGLKEFKENKSKKFSVIWKVRQHIDFVYIYPTICVKLKPEESSEDRQFIYDKRLNDWGIQEVLSSFEIVIRLKYSDANEPVENGGFYFNRCNNGKFLCRSSIKWRICDNPKNLESIEFVLKSGDLKKIIQIEKIPNYIQLWNSGYDEWSNRQINGARSSVLFLNNNASTKDGDQQILLKTKILDYYWANIKSELLIINNGNEKILYQKHGTIVVYPQNRYLFNNTICHTEEGLLSYLEGEKTSLVYLVKGLVTFDVYFIDLNGSKKVLINTIEYSKEYKTPDMSRFGNYSDKTYLNQGLVTFKIIYKNNYQESIDCYVLEPKANINRVIDTKRVIFQGVENVMLANNEFLDNENDLENDTVNIKLGTEDNYLDLPVFRALNRQNDLFLNSKYFISKNIIPIKFADSIIVRSINNEGVNRKVLAKEIDKFQKIRVIYNNNQGRNNHEVMAATGIDGKNGGIRLNTYTKEIYRNGIFYFLAEGKNISLENFNQYKFCFLSLNEPNVEDIELTESCFDSHNYVGFFVRKEFDGIVFQSFKDGNTQYQETYRPFFVAANQSKLNSKTKQDDRKGRIKKYKEEFDFKLALNHFELAIEHNLYFGIFDIMLAMEDQPKILSQFYLQYYQHSTDQKQSVDYKALHRLAEELLFDWMFIPRNIWTEVIVNDEGKKDWVTNLFKHKKTSNGMEQYALSQCCEQYWNSMLNGKTQNNEIFTNIKRVRKLDCFFIQKFEDKIRVLIELDKTENLYANLLEILKK